MVTKDDVKRSMEYCWRTHNCKSALIIYGILLLIVPALYALKGYSVEQMIPIASYFAVVMGAVVALIILCQLLWQWELVRRCEHYERHQTKLEHPHMSFLHKGCVYYHVIFADNDGAWVRLDTKAMFSDGLLSMYHMDGYNGREVEIFYDPEKDRVIVGGLLSKRR